MSRVLAKWNHSTTGSEAVFVPADGCIDLIVVRPQMSPPYWFVSELQSSSSMVLLGPERMMQGYRLRPATKINNDTLNCALVDARSFERAGEYLEDACSFDAKMDSAVLMLSSREATVSQTAADLGVSIRRLQRLFFRHQLPPPKYWHSLARVRLAVKHLNSKTNLADFAVQSGFSDQAHMTREFGRWFSVTPSQLMLKEELRTAIKQPGLGTLYPTGEQISTR